MVHLTETCDEGEVHLISIVVTTSAAVDEVRSTASINGALAEKGLAPIVHAGQADAAVVEAAPACGARGLAGVASLALDPRAR